MTSAGPWAPTASVTLKCGADPGLNPTKYPSSPEPRPAPPRPAWPIPLSGCFPHGIPRPVKRVPRIAVGAVLRPLVMPAVGITGWMAPGKSAEWLYRQPPSLPATQLPFEKGAERRVGGRRVTPTTPGSRTDRAAARCGRGCEVVVSTACGRDWELPRGHPSPSTQDIATCMRSKLRSTSKYKRQPPLPTVCQAAATSSLSTPDSSTEPRYTAECGNGYLQGSGG